MSSFESSANYPFSSSSYHGANNTSPAPSHDSLFDDVIGAGFSPDATVLRSTNSIIRQKAGNNELNTPARRYIPHLTEMTEMTECLLAEREILRCRLADAEAIIGARKECKQLC